MDGTSAVGNPPIQLPDLVLTFPSGFFVIRVQPCRCDFSRTDLADLHISFLLPGNALPSVVGMSQPGESDQLDSLSGAYLSLSSLVTATLVVVTRPIPTLPSSLADLAGVTAVTLILRILSSSCLK